MARFEIALYVAVRSANVRCRLLLTLLLLLINAKALPARLAGAEQTGQVPQAAGFWSFQPLRNPSAPPVADPSWPRGEIDRFILAQLEQQDLKPATDAPRETLVRRLYVDLLGLPPSPQQVREFVVSKDPAAYLHLVDELLSSSHFGERWGRHWLDLSRYADSSGSGAAEILEDAWKYRDYVIRSFNQDKPIDEFLREQIAGDLLPWTDLEDRAENLVATGFLVLGPRNYITDDEQIFRMDGVDEQIDTIGRVLLGMTVGCARCHDHMFDPIPATDYYALAGILDSTKSYKPIPASKNFIWNTVADPREDPDGSRLAKYEAKSGAVKILTKRARKLAQAIQAAREEGRLPDGEKGISLNAWVALNDQELADMQARLAQLKKETLVKPSTFMGVRCEADPGDTQVRIRGNAHRRGRLVPRGFLGVVSRGMPGYLTDLEIPADQSGRLQLANWLAPARNPLAARVLVNRVWYQLFGKGIVPTVDNFGTTGRLPSHPELLEWLARRFVDDGQCVKKLVRRMVLSRTYRLGGLSADSAGRDQLSRDPENRFCGRRTRRSLDAETIRDTILVVSGELDLHQGGKEFPDGLRKESLHVVRSKRRSVYTPRFRTNQLEMYQVFNAANPSLVVGQRDRTILPTQALFLMNGEFVVKQSRRAAERLLLEVSLRQEARIELMYLRTLARRPTDAEAALAHAFLAEADTATGEARVAIWAALQQTLFACVDFRFVK